MKYKCSVCGEELLNDKEWFIRKQRHEEKHKKGREHGVNNIKGNVSWITVWE